MVLEGAGFYEGLVFGFGGHDDGEGEAEYHEVGGYEHGGAYAVDTLYVPMSTLVGSNEKSNILQFGYDCLCWILSWLLRYRQCYNIGLYCI